MQRATSLSCFLIVLCALTLFIATATGLPFGKDSGVTELTPATMKGFLNTHKPVFIMFYAPWCGHCKTMHPHYEKFAKNVKEVVRVGAINADEHRELGGQFGVQGFPTIKYWPMGSKKGKQPMDYQGQRSAGALQTAAVGLISASNVLTVTSSSQIGEKLTKAAEKKVLILFSAKNKSPPILSVLSQSPHFKDKIGFLLVSEKAKEIMKEYEVESVPKLLLVSAKEGAEEGPARSVYEGKMEYLGIAKWLQALVGGGGPSSEGGEEAEAKTTTTGKKQPQEETEKQQEEPPKKPRPATPVRPTELTPDNFRTHCGPGAPKVLGQQPFCAIVLGEKRDLKPIHAHFERDSILFFYADESNALKYAQKLTDALQCHPLAREDVLIMRATKDRVKYVTWLESDKRTLPGDTLEAFVEKALAGEMTFERQPGFPDLA